MALILLAHSAIPSSGFGVPVRVYGETDVVAIVLVDEDKTGQASW